MRVAVPPLHQYVFIVKNRNSFTFLRLLYVHSTNSVNGERGYLLADFHNMRVYPKISGLAAWSENCKWYRYLPLGAVVSLFCESVY
jgi:hypothetical protein